MNAINAKLLRSVREFNEFVQYENSTREFDEKREFNENSMREFKQESGKNSESEFMNFFIPSYQRGYRWESRQVVDLCEDIWDFASKFEDGEKNSQSEINSQNEKNSQDNENSQNEKSFYCLQPLVVKFDEKENRYDVLDGQQRLTTIYLMIKALGEDDLFKIEYETRKESAEFLENIKNASNADNIDFCHILNAFEKIKEFFKKHEFNERESDKEKFKKTLLEKAKFIWYEISDENGEKEIAEKDEIAVFTRINMGKIPLTNAELIKALLLHNEKPSEKYQLNIAMQWDLIEKDLQGDDFWYFLNGGDLDTRIDLIFNLLAKNLVESKDFKRPQNLNKNDKYFAFYVINSAINENQKTKQEIWENALEIYRILKEWFEDRECFHKIGFLLHSGEEISSFLSEYQSKTQSENKDCEKEAKSKSKTEFKVFLDKQIKKQIENIDINSLTYDKDKDKREMAKILLLFNVESILQNKNSRTKFNFADFKKQSWDIEHIHSQNENLESRFKEWLEIALLYDFKRISEMIESENELENLRDYLAKHETNIKDAIKNYNEKRDKDLNLEQNAKTIYEKLFKEKAITYKNDDFINSLRNLTLLDSSTNRSYGNAFFPYKRQRIIESDKAAIFVPLCTRNVFVKYYTLRDEKPEIWSEADGNDYLKAIKNTLEKYLKKDENENSN